MVLEIPGGIFGQDDVRESGVGISNAIGASTIWRTAFSTASAPYVNVTNAIVTISGLNAAKTYTLIAFSGVDLEIVTAGKEGTIRLVINGIETSENKINPDALNSPRVASINGALTGQTGLTSYTCLLQVRMNAGGTIHVNRDTQAKSITMITIEE